ncbi:MAG: hypothetical protein ACJ74Y_07130 [Bryobacteraceae bacterium]
MLSNPRRGPAIALQQRFSRVLRVAVPALLFGWAAAPSQAQTDQQSAAILDRLDRLEKQNRELQDEIHSLRELLAQKLENGKNIQPVDAQAQGKLDEKPNIQSDTANEHEQVNEHRIEELAQTKVEASQRFPIHLTGTLLFNAFTNGANNGGAQNPTAASLTSGPINSGATVRQTVLGLTFHGPQTFLGGTVSGSLYMDFFSGSSASLNHVLRIRLATVQLDWPNTTFSVGQDKPLVSRREPNSLAQVGVSPLTNAGNPWLWQPQARIEQRFSFGQNTLLKAEAGVFQTNEQANLPADLANRVEIARPAIQARVSLKHEWGNRSVEIAPVLHASTTHISGMSIPSRLYGIDWFVKPASSLEITGMVFRGQNFANLGAIGGLSTNAVNRVIPVRGAGGWVQFRYIATQRLSFNAYGGQQDDRDRDLVRGRMAKNQYYAANVMYLLAPNVMTAFEVGQARTTYLGFGNRLNNHYDLALGYLF